MSNSIWTYFLINTTFIGPIIDNTHACIVATQFECLNGFRMSNGSLVAFTLVIVLWIAIYDFRHLYVDLTLSTCHISDTTIACIVETHFGKPWLNLIGLR